MMNIVKFVLAIIGLFIIGVIAEGFVRTWKVQHDAIRQQLFLNGTIPSPAPNGFYKGTVYGHSYVWEGKKFDAQNSKGVNIVKGNEEFPFTTSVAHGIRDNREVLKIDYNTKENPWWLRRITDEIVQIKPGEYLGKMHLNIIPGYPFSIAYFELKQD